MKTHILLRLGGRAFWGAAALMVVGWICLLWESSRGLGWEWNSLLADRVEHGEGWAFAASVASSLLLFLGLAALGRRLLAGRLEISVSWSSGVDLLLPMGLPILAFLSVVGLSCAGCLAFEVVRVSILASELFGAGRVGALFLGLSVLVSVVGVGYALTSDRHLASVGFLRPSIDGSAGGIGANASH